MRESLRLKELFDYNILDTPPEKELDDIACLASIICDKPIALIGMLDETRHWFKASCGIKIQESPRSISFCQYTLDKPDELLVVEDTLLDKRFKNSPLVVEEPHVRFYAGVPLTTPQGNVLGTLCIFDVKPGKISDKQREALKILSEKIMDYLNKRKLIIKQRHHIEDNIFALKHLTDEAPGVLFQFELSRAKFKLNFVSRGITYLNRNLSAKPLADNPMSFLKYVYSADRKLFSNYFKKAAITQNPICFEFRMVSNRGLPQWYLAQAKTQVDLHGNTVWYGNFQNITQQLEYQKAMEQISFDISHILRNPVTNLLGLSTIIEQERDKLTEEKLLEYSDYIQTVSRELDQFTRKLNAIYEKKKMHFF